MMFLHFMEGTEKENKSVDLTCLYEDSLYKKIKYFKRAMKCPLDFTNNGQGNFLELRRQ